MGRYDIDIDDLFDDDYDDIRDLDEEFLSSLCKKTAKSFFEQYGLISHQLNSYNDFIENGIQNLFKSLGEITVEPGYDPSKKGDSDWRYASVKFGKVSLQNMTYASKVKVQVDFQVALQ